MDYSDYLALDNKAITVSGFFGALTFTAMILLMQFSTEIKYSEILIPWTALVSFFFIIVTIGILNIDAQKIHPDRFNHIVMFCFIMGFYGLIFVIPALVYSFTEIGSYAILVIEIIIIIIFNTSIAGKPKPKSN